MSELQQLATLPNQPFRLGVPVHELLQRPSEDTSSHPPMLRKAETMPTAALVRNHYRLQIEANERVLRRTRANGLGGQIIWG